MLDLKKSIRRFLLVEIARPDVTKDQVLLITIARAFGTVFEASSTLRTTEIALTAFVACVNF